MAVKRIEGGLRVLAVCEALAREQPVGVGALARSMGQDKSAVQRALVTLEAAGWAQRMSADSTRWELSARPWSMLRGARGRVSVHEVLRDLRDATGETALLYVVADDAVVVADVVESRHMVRTAPTVGSRQTNPSGAGMRAVLAHSGVAATDPDFDEIRARGWAVNDRAATPGASAVAAALFDAAGRVSGAIAISGPADRLPRPLLDELGADLARRARELSSATDVMGA